MMGSVRIRIKNKLLQNLRMTKIVVLVHHSIIASYPFPVWSSLHLCFLCISSTSTTIRCQTLGTNLFLVGDVERSSFLSDGMHETHSDLSRFLLSSVSISRTSSSDCAHFLMIPHHNRKSTNERNGE
jgi:hypothetical protein